MIADCTPIDRQPVAASARSLFGHKQGDPLQVRCQHGALPVLQEGQSQVTLAIMLMSNISSDRPADVWYPAKHPHRGFGQPAAPCWGPLAAFPWASLMLYSARDVY